MSSSRHHNISILRPSLSLHCPHPNRLSLASLTASPKHLTCAVALLSYTSSPEKNLIICCLLDLQLWSLSCSHHGLLINCINPQKETVKRNTPDMFSSNRTHIRTHLHFIKLSLCRSLCAFVMFTETHTVLVLLNQTKRQTDWLSVSPLEIQTVRVLPAWHDKRQRGQQWWESNCKKSQSSWQADGKGGNRSLWRLRADVHGHTSSHIK